MVLPFNGVGEDDGLGVFFFCGGVAAVDFLVRLLHNARI